VTRGIANDLGGQRFGHLVVLKRGEPDSINRGFFWLCMCDCGRHVAVRGHLLKGRQRFCSKQCELYRQAKQKDITGKRFGRLVAQEHIGVGSGRKARWRFLCDCGKTTDRFGDHAIRGEIQSCGCLGTESRIRHGNSHTREYHREAHRQWAARNPHKVIANANKRRADFVYRIPKWLTEIDWQRIAEVYREAARLTAETGIEYHVDHILPLRGKTVSGLHVPDNLRAIPGHENQRKHRTVPEEVC